MLGLRMVRLVHRYGFRIVIDGDVNRFSERGFNANARTAAARK